MQAAKKRATKEVRERAKASGESTDHSLTCGDKPVAKKTEDRQSSQPPVKHGPLKNVTVPKDNEIAWIENCKDTSMAYIIVASADHKWSMTLIRGTSEP